MIYSDLRRPKLTGNETVHVDENHETYHCIDSNSVHNLGDEQLKNYCKYFPYWDPWIGDWY